MIIAHQSPADPPFEPAGLGGCHMTLSTVKRFANLDISADRLIIYPPVRKNWLWFKINIREEGKKINPEAAFFFFFSTQYTHVLLS